MLNMRNRYFLSCLLFLLMSCPFHLYAEGVTSGTYFIRNIIGGTYLAGANDYGTMLSLKSGGEPIKITVLNDGNCLMEDVAMKAFPDSTRRYIGLLTGDSDDLFYVDLHKTKFQINKIEECEYDRIDRKKHYLKEGTEYYRISCVGNDGERIYLSRGKKGITGHCVVAGKELDNGLDMVWCLFTRDELISDFEMMASEDSPICVTSLINDPDFSIKRNSGLQQGNTWWSIEARKSKISGYGYNYCAETYRSVFDCHQTLSCLPKGKYRLCLKATFTCVDNKDTASPCMYVKTEEGTYTSCFVKSGLHNSMNDGETTLYEMSESFTEGLYSVVPIGFYMESGDVTIGVMGRETNQWCVWDDFQLYYYGR